MITVKPFKPLLPDAAFVKEISSVPYDVIFTDEVRAEIAVNPKTFLRVTRSEAELADGASLEEANAKAKENLAMFRANGWLAQSPDDAIFVYRLETEGRAQTGFVAACLLKDYEENRIKKHEKTRPDKVIDRTEHMTALGAQTGLIFLTYKQTDALRNCLQTTVKNAPMYNFEISGVRHTVWRVADATAVSKDFSALAALYVADGHHRLESAYRAQQILAATNQNHTGTESYNFVMAGIFPSEDLKILAYNRAVVDLNGNTPEEFLSKIQNNFVITLEGEKTPANPKEFCIYLDRKWRTFRFAMDYIREPDVIEQLDVSILQDHLLKPILGIDDPRTSERIMFVGGARGTAELEKLVDSAKAAVAVSMFPTSIDDLINVSDADEIMPPKSTWFEPKLRDGLFIHQI